MAGLPLDRCGHCADCLGPEPTQHYCANRRGDIGVTLDGAFAEYIVVDSRESSLLPDAVGFDTAAPLACAGITIWGGLIRTGLKAGETVALVGAGGGLGHLGCQFGKALGLQVIGIDARDEGLALAKECGADVVVDARQGKEKVVEEVKKVTGGAGVDAAINISDAEEAAGLACAITKMHGLMVQIAQVCTFSNVPHLSHWPNHGKTMNAQSQALAHNRIFRVQPLIRVPIASQYLDSLSRVHLPRHPRPRISHLLSLPSA